MQWSKGEEYKNNSLSQEVRAKQALKGILKPNLDVLDIGCGDGKITQYIAQQVKPGIVMGFDLSQSMALTASKQVNTASFFSLTQANALYFNFRLKFDLVTSFFCLQWLPKGTFHIALKNIMQHLKPGGQFCILLPCYDFPHIIINDVAATEKWKKHFIGHKEQQNLKEDKEFYEKLLQSIDAFADIKVSKVTSEHKMTIDGFINFTRQWCGFLQYIKDPKINVEFINDVKESLKKYIDKDGYFTMKQESLHLRAIKKIPENVTKKKGFQGKL